mmetsp:Transcript_17988/g.16103  ORF Transcript_17988/g.16103 Transcript_17988/m.16103 type:complete len:83 (+) Transcript_17988:2-250(+)
MNPNKNRNRNGYQKEYKVLWDKDLKNKPINDNDANVIYVKEYDDHYGGSGSTGSTRKHKLTDTGCTDTLQSTLMGADTTLEC